jgi:lipid II:glycine glycyltransferase (peptidoglycan interpeptide bridge formation enzyme)
LTKGLRGITEAGLEVCEQADVFLQSALWGRFKSQFGWTSRAFLLEWESGQRPLLVLSRRIAPGVAMAYVPWGPQLPEGICADDRACLLNELANKLKPFLDKNTAFIRFDPPWFIEEDFLVNHLKQLVNQRLKRAAADIQPPDTVFVDLTLPQEGILAAMKSKWRYNISLAGKKGVQVNTPNEQGLEAFYALLQETAVRDGIAIHSIDYYQTLFALCAERYINAVNRVENWVNQNNPQLRLYTATHEGDTLAAIVVLFYGEYATYLYGASSGVKRNLMAPYALQWKAMQDAKAAGCRHYDLFGIPPNDDPSHPMAGLYLFKTGFGGKVLHRPGSWDYVYKPIVYRLFRIAEAARKKLRDRKKGK